MQLEEHARPPKVVPYDAKVATQETCNCELDRTNWRPLYVTREDRRPTLTLEVTQTVFDCSNEPHGIFVPLDES
jgi:hypothetical protein